MVFAALDGSRYTPLTVVQPSASVWSSAGYSGSALGMGRPDVRYSGAASIIHTVAFFVLPHDAHEAALTQIRDAGGFALRFETIKRDALHLEALLKRTVEAFTLLVGNYKRLLGSAAELQPDFIARALGSPAGEIYSLQRGSERRVRTSFMTRGEALWAAPAFHAMDLGAGYQPARAWLWMREIISRTCSAL
jgi:hypothetical protein